MSDYKVGAKISFVVPPEPEPMTVVIDNEGDASQHRPGPGRDKPWVSTSGEAWTWVELVTERGPLKVVHLGGQT